jgi:photosystem II stability/assembly factor-like uncharacterized protein
MGKDQAKDILTIRMIDSQKGRSAGAFGTILRTTNGGQSWQILSIDWQKSLQELFRARGYADPHLYDISFLDKDNGWIVGENGVLLKTTDGGKTWALKRGGLLPALFSINFRNRSEGYIVGQSGLFLQTSDGGKTWAKQDVGEWENLHRIRIEGDLGIVVCDLGKVLLSKDGGKTWTRYETKLSRFLPSVNSVAINLRKSKKEIVIGGKSLLERIEY